MKPPDIELVDEMLPALPKRSRLYRLAPQNLFSGFVESLTGYIARLAEAHCLPVSVLVTREIAPLFDRKSIIDVPNGHCDLLGKFGGAVNGNNGTAEEAIKAVERLTAQGGLRNLTMLLALNYVSATPLLRRTQAWCEECLRDWLNKGEEAYYPLLWSLSAVQICPTHKKPLVDTCSQCHRTHYPLARRLQIGFCPWCDSWLPGKAVDTQPESEGKIRLTTWETFSAESTAALITDLSRATLTRGNSHSYFKDNISNLVEKLFAGSENAMADYTGTHRVSVCNWSSGKQVPSLRAVLLLAYRFNIFASSVLLSPLDEAKVSLRLPASPGDEVFLRPPLKRTFPNKIEQTLRAAIEHPTWPPSSLRNVVRKPAFIKLRRRTAFLILPGKYRIIIGTIGVKRGERLRRLNSAPLSANWAFELPVTLWLGNDDMAFVSNRCSSAQVSDIFAAGGKFMPKSTIDRRRCPFGYNLAA